jgi:hypothetical protein
MKSQEVVSLLERFPELFDTDDELLEELTAEMHDECDDDPDRADGNAHVEPEGRGQRQPR